MTLALLFELWTTIDHNINQGVGAISRNMAKSSRFLSWGIQGKSFYFLSAGARQSTIDLLQEKKTLGFRFLFDG
jgi:hypothetical protein